jgi:ornithine cyclodeaminase/alanine dehydrogenase-like protein (mu-crystallin family)
MTILLEERDVEQLLTARSAIPIIEKAFRMAGQGRTENPARFRMPIRAGFLQFGPAALHEQNVMGFKLWANFGTPIGATHIFLYSLETSELLAIIQAYTIGKYRTAATSAVAARYLSSPQASRLGVYGTGRQAGAQIEAICAVRPIRQVRVYGRNAQNRADFCARIRSSLGLEVTPVERPEDAAVDADIVVTITKAETPILFADWLNRPGLVIAAGANHWYKREIDSSVVEKAALVVVDEIEQGKVEGGNLLWPMAHGRLNWNEVEELGDCVCGRVTIPSPEENLILFESHGLAIEDVAISKAAFDLAKEQGCGRPIAL